MKEKLITDINACYKNIDENTISVILEIKKNLTKEYEMIFKYTFSLNKLEKNSIEIYKDITIPELYDIYELLKKYPNCRGVFDIYFKVYQNELNNLRNFAIEKLNELNNPKKEEKNGMFEQVKSGVKTFFKELMEKGSTNKLNGTITKVAAYKKECPKENIGEYANRCVIDIIRYGTDSWENIYSHEYGKYKTGGTLTDINSVSVYKILSEEDIFKMMSLLNNKEEYEVMSKYLKTVPKEPHGDIYENKEEKLQVENIKFL